ncbi:hypothetical protein UP09_07110 [Bradyrhizobium sp. LTSP885]|uniref:hypothetical protein n=1 Tax=Bradyrhizobium sp. LTSP885 TaxID=1619232 RepID=UPI0005CA7223|nr:hypothetical protein [Bradyrhizobium sp. LTSP885]KJC49464.1 hypothetical protein UP09_07110 [Bradyrhizobium sp. LTSP885]
MTELLIFAFLVGAVVGQRFQVFVLLPLTIAIALVAIPIGLIANLTFFDGLKDVVFCALALQAGYLFGSAARFWLAAARASRVFSRSFKTAR